MERVGKDSNFRSNLGILFFYFSVVVQKHRTTTLLTELDTLLRSQTLSLKINRHFRKELPTVLFPCSFFLFFFFNLKP